MDTEVREPEVNEPGHSSTRRRIGITVAAVVGGIVVALVVAVTVVVVGIGVYHREEARPLPTFPSLATTPDPSLQGTVAYLANDTRCIRIVAAAGAPSRDVWCIPPEGPEVWKGVGKPAGPQLAWRPDGRLEVTMFRMVPPASGSKSAPPLEPGWQKVIDVRTGAIEDTPTSALPSAPDESSLPTTNARGERVTTKVDGNSGKVKVTLATANETRTLLSVHGPGEYMYRFEEAFWAPSGDWITTADDGRILIITPTDPSATRVLVTGSGGGVGGPTVPRSFAVTSENFFPTGSF